MLKQRLMAEGERIVKIVGVTILPRVHHLAPSFPFLCLFKGFGNTKEGKMPKTLPGRRWPIFSLI
jgi:hypothetical protein